MWALRKVVILHVVGWGAEPLENAREASDAGVGMEAAGLVGAAETVAAAGSAQSSGDRPGAGTAGAGAGWSRILARVAGPGLRVRTRLYSESALVRSCFEI